MMEDKKIELGFVVMLFCFLFVFFSIVFDCLMMLK